MKYFQNLTILNGLLFTVSFIILIIAIIFTINRSIDQVNLPRRETDTMYIEFIAEDMVFDDHEYSLVFYDTNDQQTVSYAWLNLRFQDRESANALMVDYIIDHYLTGTLGEYNGNFGLARIHYIPTSNATYDYEIVSLSYGEDDITNALTFSQWFTMQSAWIKRDLIAFPIVLGLSLISTIYFVIDIRLGWRYRKSWGWILRSEKYDKLVDKNEKSLK